MSEPSRKKIIETHKLEKDKFSYKIMNFMTKIENHIMVLDKDFQVLTNIVETLNFDMLDELKILEIEKNKLRLELGSRKNFIMNQECDDSSVWEH